MENEMNLKNETGVGRFFGVLLAAPALMLVIAVAALVGTALGLLAGLGIGELKERFGEAAAGMAAVGGVIGGFLGLVAVVASSKNTKV